MSAEITADDDFTEVPPNRIFDVGYGTWIVFLAFMTLVVIFLATDPLRNRIKWVWRSLSCAIFSIMFLLLLFAERSKRFNGQGAVVKV